MIQGLLLALYSSFLPAKKLQNSSKLHLTQDKEKKRSHFNRGFELLKEFVVSIDSDYWNKWLKVRPEKHDVYIELSDNRASNCS